jgi:small multidrug resistance pump
MSFGLLLLAIGLEVAGTTCMKLSQGFSRLVPSVLIVVFYGGSLASLTFALKTIEVSTAYAIWSGLGTALIAGIGCWYFGEVLNSFKVAGVLLVVAGIVLLHLSGKSY